MPPSRTRHGTYCVDFEPLVPNIAQVSVLDIGTGSGLLAMMAHRAGAARTTACECFAPVGRAAAACLAANDLSDAVTLVHKASTQMSETDLRDARRAHVIVNELYDTELLGEGVIPTLRHALAHLAVPGATVVPAAADVFVQLLDSPEAAHGYDPSAARTPAGHQLFPPAPGADAGAGDSGGVCTAPAESLFADRLVARGAAAPVGPPAAALAIDFCRHAVPAPPAPSPLLPPVLTGRVSSLLPY